MGQNFNQVYEIHLSVAATAFKRPDNSLLHLLVGKLVLPTGFTLALFTVGNKVVNSTTETCSVQWSKRSFPTLMILWCFWVFGHSCPKCGTWMLNLFSHIPQIPTVRQEKNCASSSWYHLWLTCLVSPLLTPQQAPSEEITPFKFSLAQNHLRCSPMHLNLAGQSKIILSGWRALETMACSSWELLK